MKSDTYTMSKKITDLGKDSIGSLLFKLATPAIIAQVVNVLYNIVDRIFIGRMENGELAMAGVGVSFPIILLISAFSALVGYGGAPLAAIKMGENDHDGAEKIVTNAFSSLIILSLILTATFTLFKEPILWAFGASDATITYALEYTSIYVMGTIFVQIALGMNPFINTQGFAKFGMITVLVGAITNIVLDPIFIFGFDMGVSGAALATVSAQAVSALWVLAFLRGKQNKLRIRREYLIPSPKIVLSIVTLGISPFIMQSTESLVLISLNSQLMLFGGDLAVGAMTIMSSVMQIVTLPLMGLTSGAQPIISYNFGAKQFDRVRQTFRLLISITLPATMLMCFVLVTFPTVFVNIFNDDPALVEVTADAMRIYFSGIFLLGAQFACQQTFLALGQAKISLVLALLRKILLLVPLIFILPMILDNQLDAVFLAEPIADILASLSTITAFTIFYRRVLNVKDADALVEKADA